MKTRDHRFFQKIDKRAFSEFKEDIALYNLRTLRQISFVGMVVAAIMVLLSLPPIRLFTMIYSYLAITILFAAMYAWCALGLKRFQKFVIPTFYLTSIIIMFFAAIMGTYLGQGVNATTVLFMIIALPLFIIDKPWRISLFFGIAVAGFCVLDFNVKYNITLRNIDIANSTVFYLLSMALSRQTIITKLSDIIIKHELKQQRDMDMLTKLNNRGSFERIVDQYLHESNQNAVLLIMDIDNFKSVNDTMGHAYGDTLLRTVGEYLKSTFRSGDTVSRMGGDEFIAFLPAVTDLDVIKSKVNQLLLHISEIKMPGDDERHPSVSIGMARYPSDGCSFEELYKRADSALYHAKRSGKGRYAVYDEFCVDSGSKAGE